MSDHHNHNLGSDTSVTRKILYRGKIIQSLNDDHCDFFEDGGLLCQGNRILGFGQFDLLESEAQEVYEFRDNFGLQTVLPPFSDIHFHWVQDRVSSMAKGRLLDWLENFVFPEEQKFSDIAFVRQRAAEFSKKLFRCGTLSGAVYSSIHSNTFQVTQDFFVGHFLVGNVVMTNNSPRELIQSKRKLFNQVKAFVENPKYVITPRFALSCDAETLLGLKKLVSSKRFIQTHLSETRREIQETLNMYRKWPEFCDVDSYLEIYRRAGLIQKRCILGHCIHLTSQEWKILADTQAAIAHCPTSNAPRDEDGLGSGLFELERARSEGVRWALASDIGAGPYLSMLDVMQSFLSQHRSVGRVVSAKEALYRATIAGAHILEAYYLTGFKPGNLASFCVFPSVKSNNPEECIEQLLDRPRNQFNQLSRAVCHAGRLEIFD